MVRPSKIRPADFSMRPVAVYVLAARPTLYDPIMRQQTRRKIEVSTSDGRKEIWFGS